MSYIDGHVFSHNPENQEWKIIMNRWTPRHEKDDVVDDPLVFSFESSNYFIECDGRVAIGISSQR